MGEIIDDSVRETMIRLLKPGEELLWSGRPKKGIIFYWFDYIAIPVGLLLGGVFIWSMLSESSGPRILFPPVLLIAPLLLMLFHFLIGRFFINAKQREKTFYALTSERIIISSGLFKRRQETINLCDLPELVLLKPDQDGTGTIVFGTRWDAILFWLKAEGTFYQQPALKLELIENAQFAYKTILEALKARKLKGLVSGRSVR